MIDTSLFQNAYLLWPVSIVAFVLWMVFLWKEWSRPLKNRFYLYVLVSLITILSFAMLALKPLSKSVMQAKSAVLLTKGYSQNQLDSIKNNVSGITSIDYQENLPIEKNLDSISHLFVLGNGVESYDLWQFENRSVTYLGADVPAGIIDLKYNRKGFLRENLKIAGRYHSAKASHRLVLQDGNSQGLDSIVLNGEEFQKFDLSTPLKATGKFVFQLVEKDSLGETILTEPLPFKVLDKTGVKVLLVNGFPTFETKYLKNYLAEMGHEVVVRSQLTRGRYKFEYFNTKRRPVYRLGEKELEDFDLLIIDGSSFDGLSEKSWKSVENAIKNSELGLFVQLESNLLNRSSKRLGLKFERDGITKTVLNEFPKLRLEKFPFRFKSSNGLEEIHSTNRNAVTGYKRLQKGRLGATLIQNTYQLQLDGKKDDHSRFWAEIVTKLSKKKELITDWKAPDNFPLENNPFQFELRTTIENPEVFSDGKNQIPLKQHIDITSLWSGTTYPKHKGWNSIYLKDDIQTGLDFYVLDSSAWKSLRAKEKQNENKRYFTNTSEEFKRSVSTSLINPIWFFVLGVLGLGFLWLHPKIFQP